MTAPEEPVEVHHPVITPIDDLTPHPRNWRRHPGHQLAHIKASLVEHGVYRNVVATASGVILAGHGVIEASRQLGLADVPVVFIDTDPNSPQAMKLLTGDNTLGGFADDDLPLMTAALNELADIGELLGTGYDDDTLAALIADDIEPGGSIDGDPDNIPDAPEGDPITKPGDVWHLGPHRLVCGDSTEPATLDALMGGETAIVVHADPPYGMNKDIANDNLHGPNLDAFQMRWWKTCRPHLADNGSVYIWGKPEDLWRLWWVGGLRDSGRLSWRNDIAWKKGAFGSGGGTGVGQEIQRSYFPETERCLFAMLGDQEQSVNADDYWEGWEPIRSYLDGERQRMGWGKDDIGRITGTTGDMMARWFSKSQWSMPTREHYEAFQRAAGRDAFHKEWDEIHKEWDEIHKEWLAARAPFDNTHDNMTDVWDFPRVTGDDRWGHETPKPVALCERVHRTSAPRRRHRPGPVRRYRPGLHRRPHHRPPLLRRRAGSPMGRRDLPPLRSGYGHHAGSGWCAGVVRPGRRRIAVRVSGWM